MTIKDSSIEVKFYDLRGEVVLVLWDYLIIQCLIQLIASRYYGRSILITGLFKDITTISSGSSAVEYYSFILQFFFCSQTRIILHQIYGTVFSELSTNANPFPI